MRHFNILQTAESIYAKVINLRKTRCLYLNADADADADANTDAEISKWSLIIAIHILLNISRSKDNEN